MSRRLYLGRLPQDTQRPDIDKLFEGYGRILDCRVMTGFGFVEFENPKDAEEVVQAFNGKPFLGQSIIVEFARENRRRGEYDGGRPAPRDSRRDAPPPRVRRPPGFRLIISGLARDTSWQDLKDFGREAGNVSFADVDRDYPGSGILEYLTQEDADDAVKRLDGKELRGVIVRVEHADPGAKDAGRERYRSPPRRSRSPPRRREDYRRRSRSPRGPPARRDDDRRDDYRREEYRRDDHRRDDRERSHREPYERREEREPAAARY